MNDDFKKLSNKINRYNDLVSLINSELINQGLGNEMLLPEVLIKELNTNQKINPEGGKLLEVKFVDSHSSTEQTENNIDESTSAIIESELSQDVKHQQRVKSNQKNKPLGFNK